jgi:molybdopterin/thiamine biosynthesis adenylyltransferase
MRTTMQARDARLAASPGLDGSALARLQSASVVVVGAGLLGGSAASHLAMLGVSLVVVDPGLVEEANLGNQGFPMQAVGEPRAVVRARQLGELNPDCRITPVVRRIEDLGLGALAGADVILGGLDGRAARAALNVVAWALGIPWVDGAVDGSGRWLHGTVTCFDPRADSACYLCADTAADVGSIGRQGRGPGCPSWRRAEAPATEPTLQASAFGAVVAGLAVGWVVRMLLGRGEALVGRRLVVEGDPAPRLRTLALTRNPACVFSHDTLEPVRCVADAQVGRLLEAAAGDLGGRPASLRLHGRPLVDGLECLRCGHTRPLVRLARACTDDDVACACGEEMTPRLLTEWLRGELLERASDFTWKEIGLPVAEMVTAAHAGASAHYIVNGRPLP